MEISRCYSLAISDGMVDICSRKKPPQQNLWVQEEAIRAVHRDNTAQRAAQARKIIVAHDTTEFNFGKNPRQGLGYIGAGKSYGFYGHFSLAVEHSEERTPLGVIAMQTYHRNGKQKERGHKASHSELQDDPTNEGVR